MFTRFIGELVIILTQMGSKRNHRRKRSRRQFLKNLWKKRIALLNSETSNGLTVKKETGNHHPLKNHQRDLSICSKALLRYKCTNCSFKTPFKVDLTKHEASRHGHKFEHYSFNSSNNTCRHCHFETFSQLIYLNHIYVKCPELEERVNSAKKNLKSHIVGRWLKFKMVHSESLEKHAEQAKFTCLIDELVTNQWFFCEHCSFSTKWKDSLQLHYDRMHPFLKKITWLKCQYCRFRTVDKIDLAQHKHKRHRGAL